MKKVIKYMLCFSVLIVAGVGQADAQHYFGIRGGYGSGSGRFYPKPEMGTIWGLYHGGISWKFYTDESFVGGIEVDGLYMQQGFKIWHKGMDPNNPTEQIRTGYEQRMVDVAMVPIMWQPHIYMFRQKLRVFMNAGITFSYVMSSKLKNVTFADNGSEEKDYDMKLTRDNRFGYGLVGGGGISWSAGRVELFTEVRYYIGYSDILKRKTKYEDNDYQRTPLDGLQISAGIYYRLGKGGIRSPQGRGVNRDMARRLKEDAQAREKAEQEALTPQNHGAPEMTKGDTDTLEDPAKSRKERRAEERENKKKNDDGNDQTAQGSKTDTERH